MCVGPEIPDYEPDLVDLPHEVDFKDPASDTAHSAESRAKTKAMRTTTELTHDSEAESFADY